MNPRERALAMTILGLVILGGLALMTYQFLLVPLRARDARIAALREENETKRQRIAQVLAERPKLEWWRRLSLPADADLARRDYEKYLTELLRQSGFAATSFSVTPRPVDAKSSPTLPGKGPIYTRLTFNVAAHGRLSGLVDFLERFYRTGLLHQVRNLTVQRPLTTGPQQGPRELDINLTIEALIVSGTDNRSELLPAADPRLVALDVAAALRQGPALALAAWGAAGPRGPLGRRVLADPPRAYAALAARDVFYGPPQQAPPPERNGNDVDVTRFVYLTDITRDSRRAEAFLYDRYNNRKTRLRDSAGFNTFRFLDDRGDPVVRGQVVRIDARDVIVRVEDDYYALHVGQSLEEALRRPLTDEEVELLQLAEDAGR